ncbi:hypothetical protein BR63_03155 [Thermanaerosceptrum fracticalcis]|uniref:Uncharacterized protein n=1 Tax=Thermanaerosceptrum fracticalcis TaxID=1712410 RepID=A0A7G6DZZ4_THEFR|nr:hypothetical protein [Thermanaerosceptrum fracticalcis]QNB45398.1 hypothetical protein BR63_03155 [Thermanaerosceptrum fracticalcis]
MLKKILLNNKGYGTIEYLILFAASAVMGGVILSQLMPNLRQLHEGIETNIRDISNSGY